MSTIEYSLFRANFIRPSQTSFLSDDLPSRDLFMRALGERPSAELREGYIWHIGNIQLFSNYSGYFAVGRTTSTTIEKFDDATGNFIEEELRASPYTHCVFNADIGLIGIAKKASLAPTAKGLASRVQQLLFTAPIVQQNSITVEISAIPDPEGFLRAIASAYRVLRYTATFHGPNPFDADAHFQRPLSIYLSAANGRKGKAQIQGEDLNREVLQEVTRSTAATGNEASARISKGKSQRPITINLRGDPIKKSYDEGDHVPAVVTEDLTTIYNRVRGDERN
jgi:hypothetical protein